MIQHIVTQVLWPWQCSRVCPQIEVSSDTSVMIVSGDRTLTAECDQTMITGDNSVVWDKNMRHRHTLLLSCTDIDHDNNSISGRHIIIIIDTARSTMIALESNLYLD